MLDDGTYGLMAIKLRGGLTIVQNPAEALYPGMPASACAHVEVDRVAPVSEIAGLICRAVAEPLPADTAWRSDVTRDNGEIEQAEEIIRSTRDSEQDGTVHGTTTSYRCPECGGGIWQFQDAGVSRFQCYLGHAYSLQTLLVEQADDLEQSLWNAVRALSYKASLARQMLARYRGGVNNEIVSRYEEQAEAASRNVNVLKRLIESGIFDPQYEARLADAAADSAAGIEAPEVSGATAPSP